MTAIELNSVLMREIDGISSDPTLIRRVIDYIRRIKKTTSNDDEGNVTAAMINKYCGTWDDSRSSQEIIADIYDNRHSKSEPFQL